MNTSSFKFKFNKYQKIILFSILLTTFFLLYQNTTQSQHTHSLRSLTYDKDLIDICEQTSKNYFTFYKETPSDFSYQITSKGRPNPLAQYLEDNDINHLKEYIPRLIPYLVFIVIFCFFIISFMIYCFICCCCPTCCCPSKPNQPQSTNCAGCIFTSAILFYCLVLISLMVDILLIKNIKESMNETVCSILTVPYSFEGGLNNNSFSNWKGTTSIIKAMNSTVNIINVITQYKDSYLTMEHFNESFMHFNEQLSHIKQTYMNNTIKNPDTYNSNDYIEPIYISHSLSNIINQTQINFDKNILIPSFAFYNVVSISNDLIYYRNNVIKNINATILKLNEIDNIIFRFITSKGNELIQFQKYLNDYGYFMFLIFLCFIGVLSLFGILFIILYAVVSVCQKIRYVINIIWVMIMIMTFFNFIYGIVFGLIGLVSIDVSLVLYNVTSSDNLQSENPLLLHNKNISLIFDRCVNKDGNLSLEFGLYNYTLNDNDNVNQYNCLQSLYDYFPIINDLYNNMMHYSNSMQNIMQIYMNELDLYRDNVYLVYDNLKLMLNELNSYTNVDNYNDIWIIEYNECPNGVNITNHMFIQFNNTQQPKCILFNNSIELFNCTERYELLNDSSRICSLIFSISEFISNNNELIINIQNDVNHLSLLYSEIYDDVQSKINFSNLFISSLYDTYNPLNIIDNKTEIFSILDCSYLKPYVYKIYESLEKRLSKQSFIFSSFLLSTCFLCWNTVTFSLLIIWKFKRNKIAPSTNTEMDDKSMFMKPQKLNIVEGEDANVNVLQNGEKIIIQKVKVDESIKIKN